MLPVLQFIFSSFWIWLGTIGLILAIGSALNAVIVAFKGTKVDLLSS